MTLRESGNIATGLGVNTQLKYPALSDDALFREFEAYRQWRDRQGSQQAEPPPAAERTIGEMHAEWLLTLGPTGRLNRTSQGRYLWRPFSFRAQKLVLGELRPSQCTGPVLTAWQAMVATSPLGHDPGKAIAPSTADQIRIGLQSMWKYFSRLGELTENPWRNVPRIAGRHRERQGYMTPDEMERFAAAYPLIGQYIIRHMFWTGCRRGNIQRLQKHEIDWEASDLVLVQKGGRPLRVAVPPPVLEELKHLCAVSTSQWVYPSPYNPQRYVPNGTWQRWTARAQKTTGLTLAGEKAVPHHARHGAAVDMIAHGADLTEVQAQLGHTTIAMTARYAKMRDRMRDRLRAKLAARLVK